MDLLEARSKTHDGTASGRPPTVQQTPCNTACAKTAAQRDLMPFLTSAIPAEISQNTP